MPPSRTAQSPLPDGAGGACSAAITSYSIWIFRRPAVETARVIMPPSRVQASLLFVAPLPIAAMSPAAGSRAMVPGDSAPARHAVSVQPSSPAVHSLAAAVTVGGRGVAAARAAGE